VGGHWSLWRCKRDSEWGGGGDRRGGSGGADRIGRERVGWDEGGCAGTGGRSVRGLVKGTILLCKPGHLFAWAQKSGNLGDERGGLRGGWRTGGGKCRFGLWGGRGVVRIQADGQYGDSGAVGIKSLESRGGGERAIGWGGGDATVEGGGWKVRGDLVSLRLPIRRSVVRPEPAIHS